MQRTGILLGATVVGAALLRLATIDSQSFGDFETYTVVLQRMDFGSMVSEIPEFEGTPPLYYVLSWFWAQLFGTGEVGLRTLPAILSIATVPVAYAIGKTLVNARVGLVAALLMAVNPLAVWYAQEARAYALLMFLTALGLWFFARLLRDAGSRNWNLVGWSAASAAALLTHYFAALVIVPEAVWLYMAASARRPVIAAMVPPAITGAALIPLIVEQSEQAGGGEPEATALATRVAQFPKQFLVGYDIPLEVPLAIAGGALVLLSFWLLIRRADPETRRGAQVAGVIAASGALLLLLLAVVGADTRGDPSIDVRPPSEFKLVDSTETDSFERLRFRASEPARASPLELLDRPPGSVPVAFYYQPG